MIVSVQPSEVSGVIYAAPSKSAMQRVCAAALIRKGRTVIHNPGFSNDEKAAVGVVEQLGGKASFNGKELIIESEGIHPLADLLSCGESGLAIRMFAPIAALSNKRVTITGEGSLLNRPVHFFNEVLPLLGVQVDSHDGKPPLTIQGPLIPRNIEIDGSLSSQFLTGMLMVYSAANAKNVAIKVNDLKSKPYIDLTLQVMKELGLKLPKNDDYQSFSFDATDTSPVLSPIHYTVEGDWSGAAFLLVAAAVAGTVRVNGLHNTSRQADKKIVDVLLDAGAEVMVGEDHVEVSKGQLQAFVFDATDCPDLFPPLVALAANCDGVSKIRGLKRLKHKESDRGITLKEEFNKLSTRIDLMGDEMLVYGNGRIYVKTHTLNSHNDHRIAMALAVACLNADFEVEIRNADAVKKSYPAFWDDMKSLKADISLRPFTTGNTYTL